MKKTLAIFLILALIPITGCSKSENTSDKILITATLFPQYDFAREIGGNKVEVTLLLPPGVESHHYDPSPSDMANISESDLFIYTGDAMEGWAGEIASSLNSDVEILNASDNIDLFSYSDESDHEHSVDPHIWLDIDNAKKMCVNIAARLILISPENSGYFTDNLTDYLNRLTELDQEYSNLFAHGQSKDIVFGGKFALGYLMRKYNIQYQSAYDSCSANAEPAPKAIAAMSDYVKENDIKIVFCEEFSDPKVAKEIASSNNARVEVLHSCHNISKEERDNNETFISLMEKNLEYIRKGLE